MAESSQVDPTPTAGAPATRAGNPPVPRARVVVASTAGIFVESLDWTVYALLAPYFAEQIFPGDNQTAARLGAYAVFAAAFLARPVGSLLMGRITDVRGRRAGLVASVALLAIGSLIIAITPTYSSVGLLAAGIVLIARLLQGIGMGGEVATAATYVVEVAPANRRHRYGAFAYSGDAFGTLAGTAVLVALLAVMQTSGVESGGWRIAFFVAAACGALAFWIRTGVPESEVFTHAREAGYKPAWPQIRSHLPRMFLAFGLTIGSTMGVYFGSIYMPSFAVHSGLVDEKAATSIQLVALGVLVVSMIASGFLSDRFGPLEMIRIGFTGAAVLVVPLMWGFLNGVVPLIVAAPALTMFIGLQLGVTPVAGARLFPVPIRGVGLGIPAALAIALFGGTFLYVAEWLVSKDQITLVPVYAGIGLTISAVGSWLVRYSLLYPVNTMVGTAAETDELTLAAESST